MFDFGNQLFLEKNSMRLIKDSKTIVFSSLWNQYDYPAALYHKKF